MKREDKQYRGRVKSSKKGGILSYLAFCQVLAPAYVCNRWPMWLQIWYIIWVRRVACQKQLLGPKLAVTVTQLHGA